MSRIAELAEAGEPSELRAELDAVGALDIAEELSRLAPAAMAVPFRLLTKDRALEVFEALDPVHQQQLLEGLRDERVRELVAGLDPDDRARLLDEVPAKVAKRLQQGLSAAQRAETATLLGYPAESAGRIMTPAYVSLRASMTAADAVAKVRRQGGDAETVYTLPVTDDRRILQGVVGLRALVTAAPATPVAALMATDVLRAEVTDDQEDVARLMQEADLLALPVVDHESRLVGVVTVDDAMEVLEREVTEDVSRSGAVEPLEQPYLSAGVGVLARKRAAWLLLLGIAAVLTVNVLGAFEATLEEVVTLALFIPLLIDTGGNSGAQASTVVIRALSLGEVRFGDLPRVAGREVLVGVVLGAMLAAVALPAVSLFFGLQFGTIIALTLLAIVVWATLAGAVLPLIGARVGLDPAVMAAPIITTLVDATGLLIYFGIATAVLAGGVG